MKNDILPPGRRRTALPQEPALDVHGSPILPRPVPDQQGEQQETKTAEEGGTTKAPKRKKLLMLTVAGVVSLAALAALVALSWFYLALRPVNSQETNRERVEIQAGS